MISLKNIKNLNKYLSPALLSVILCAIITGILLFIPPINGLADNGDFYRAMLSEGIYRLPLKHIQSINFIELKFGIMQYFNENHGAVFSSQSLVIKTALFLNKLFYSNKIFDIRFLALIYYVFYLGAIYLLTNSLVYPYKKKQSYFISLLVVFIFADSSFILYFNSFYAEPGMFIAALYIFSILISFARNCYKKQWPLAIFLWLAVIFLITNKQQNAPLALSFSVMLIGFFYINKEKKNIKKFITVFGIFSFLLSGVITYKMINKEFNTVNMFQSFSHGVLMETGDPTNKISKSGLDKQYALMRQQDYYPKNYAPIKPSNAYIENHLLDKYNVGWIVKYYLKNPKQFMNLLDVAAKDVMLVQVKAVGDFTRTSKRPPGSQVIYFTGYSAIMGSFFPRKFLFLCLIAVTLIIVYGVGFYIDLKAEKKYGILRFFLILCLMSIILFVPIVSIIGDGEADLAKHIFLVPVSIDLALLLVFSDILHGTLWSTSREVN